MSVPNKKEPKKQGETCSAGNQVDPSQTMNKDRKNQQSTKKEYTEGGGFGMQHDKAHRDIGQSIEGNKDDTRSRKEAVPNQQDPVKKQDKEPVTADSTEKSGAKK